MTKVADRPRARRGRSRIWKVVMSTNRHQIMGNSSALVEQVVDAIAQAILDGDFVSGQRLTAVEIAEWLGVSRTPVREAFMLLFAKRLLDKESSRSYVVARWDEDDLLEVGQLRTALETLAVEIAIPRVTAEDLDYMDSIVMQMQGALARGDTKRLVELDFSLHSSLWRIAGNSRLQQALEDLRVQVNFFISVTHPGDDVDYPESHQALVSALRAGDVEKAREVIQSHIMSTVDRAIARMAASDGTSS